MNRKLPFTAFLLLLAYLAEAQGSCWRFGHRCWGGHGKRSGGPPLSPPSIPIQPVEISSLNLFPEEDEASYNYNTGILPPSSPKDFTDSILYQTEDRDSMAPSGDVPQIAGDADGRKKYIPSLSSVIYSSYKQSLQALSPVLTDDKFGPLEEQYGDVFDSDHQQIALESTDPESEQTVLLDYSSDPAQDIPGVPYLFLRIPRINQKTFPETSQGSKVNRRFSRVH